MNDFETNLMEFLNDENNIAIKLNVINAIKGELIKYVSDYEYVKNNPECTQKVLLFISKNKEHFKRWYNE